MRSLRKQSGLTQAQLAQRLTISTSYINLIENNRRKLPADLMIDVARVFEVDLETFSEGTDRGLVQDLHEVFSDPVFSRHGLDETHARELCATSPEVGRALLDLFHAYLNARESADTLAENVSDHPKLPSEQVSAFIQRQGNHFSALEEGAEKLRRDAGLEDEVSEDLFNGLARYAETELGVTVIIERIAALGGSVRRYDPRTRTLRLAEVLRRGSRNFQLAHQIALLTQSAVLDQLSTDRTLTADESRALCRIALANYFAGAVLMPYSRFLEAAREERYDVEMLSHRFRTSFEQVCHRLTTLRRPSAEGVPFHLVRIDIAGNISKRFSASGIRFARFGPACPRWNVHTAFMTPGTIRVQLSRMTDGNAYFCFARTLRKESSGYLSPHPVVAIGMGCRVEHANELVYSAGVALGPETIPTEVGVTCRLCDREGCAQRAFPPLHQPLRINENVRGVSFFGPGRS